MNEMDKRRKINRDKRFYVFDLLMINLNNNDLTNGEAEELVRHIKIMQEELRILRSNQDG